MVRGSLIFLVSILLFLASCSSGKPEEPQKKASNSQIPDNRAEAAAKKEISSFYREGQLNITFVNPGRSDEVYWLMVTQFMEAAAEDLDIALEVLYAERSHISQVRISREVLDRPQPPDYLLVVNEKSVAPEIIAYAEERGVPNFLILNDLTEEQKALEGRPRGKYEYWIGSLIPNNTKAGYLIAEKTFGVARENGIDQIEMLSVSGSRATPASQERDNGLAEYLKEDSQSELLHQVYGEWEYEKAYAMVRGLLGRYTETNLIWCANDPMALGALAAARERGRVPGEDIFIGGLNWSQEALAEVQAGNMAVTVGGHFMTGGWALVLLYDYHYSKDFAQDYDSEIEISVFYPITQENIGEYLNLFGEEDWSRIDFTRFSRLENPSLGSYDFSLPRLLETIR